MRGKIKCPVCRETLELKEGALAADRVVCTACGSQLELKDRGSQLEAKRWPQPPEEEIRGRIDTFARLKGLEVSDRKERIIAGLIKKFENFGDFYCPCRLENNADNVCPCKETRENLLTREKCCHCGLFCKAELP
ncbi:MAG: hypothetical protein GX364_07765 [Firmicutes bacterium]|jgi:ferredoxin-thioredoxin reductase catalytic subunit|nr:hypothetical protein [Bacillota bacterium]